MTEETWTKYSQKILSKFPQLKKAIKEGRLQLPKGNIKKYIYDFPSDYGGLGEVLEEREYEKVNFFENKVNKNKQTPSIDLRNGLLCVPLESRNENLNIIYNQPTYKNIFPSINNPISHELGHPHAFPHGFPPAYPMPFFPFFRPPTDQMFFNRNPTFETSESSKREKESSSSPKRKKEKKERKYKKEHRKDSRDRSK